MKHRGDHSSSAVSVAPLAGGRGRKGSSGNTSNVLCCANNGNGGVRRSQPKQQHMLKPLSRGQPGYVYSKKMTLGCKPSLPSSKLQAKNKCGSTTLEGRDGGVAAARLILPWWQHSTPKIGADSKQVEPQSASSDDASGLARSQGGATCHHADAHLHDTPKGAVAVGEQSPPQTLITTLTPESPPNCQVGHKDGNRLRITADGDNPTTEPHTVEIFISPRNSENEQQGTREYAHHSNLFENPPPSIPTVDQYIFDDNITYEAITKRRHRKALPLSRRGFLGIAESGDSPWGATFCGGVGGVGSVGGGEALDSCVNSSALLYADEDIDQVMKNIFVIMP